MTELERKCGDCAWFKNNPELEQMDRRDPYGLCEARFKSTRPHLPDARFEGAQILLERVEGEDGTLSELGRTLYKLFGEDGRIRYELFIEERRIVYEHARTIRELNRDKFIPVEIEFTEHLSVGTFSNQSCHERDDSGNLLFTPK